MTEERPDGQTDDPQEVEILEPPPRDNLVRIGSEVAFRSLDSENTDGRLGTLFGTLVTFNQWAEINSQIEGHFMERSLPGAFTKTFAENRARMQVIFDHGQDRNIGRKPLGPLELVNNDGLTITYEAGLIDTSYNRDLLPGLRAGLYGSSWRMTSIKADFKNRGVQRSDHNPLALPEVTIREARILELGPTPFPAYFGTSAGIRSMTDEYLAQVVHNGPATALAPAAEASPHSGETSRVVYPPISLDDFVRNLTNGA